MRIINVNGTICTSEAELDAAISDLSEEQKNFIRNDFYGISNAIPSQATPRQIRLALTISGISIETIDAAIEAMPEPDRSLAKIEWEYATYFARDNQLMNSMAQGLGMTEEQIDGLFSLASTL